MESFKEHTGIDVPLMNDNIDTDQIIPKGYLKRIEKTGFGKYLFDDWRYLEDRTLNPDFILNAPQYQQASILISGDNIGSGSSREHAAWALLDYGFKVIIAGSFSDIFYMNAIKNGLLPIRLAESDRKELAEESNDTAITVDLVNRIVMSSNKVYPFEMDATWKHKLVNGLDYIAITLDYEEQIEAFERMYAK